MSSSCFPCFLQTPPHFLVQSQCINGWRCPQFFCWCYRPWSPNNLADAPEVEWRVNARGAPCLCVYPLCSTSLPLLTTPLWLLALVLMGVMLFWQGSTYVTGVEWAAPDIVYCCIWPIALPGRLKEEVIWIVCHHYGLAAFYQMPEDVEELLDGNCPFTPVIITSLLMAW